MKCVQSVRVTPSEKTVKQGTWYYGACATVCPTNATNRRVTWHSDNPNIASVNPDTGYIYGNNYGTTNVYATSCDGSEIEDYITITVSNTVPVTSVEVNAGVITIMEGNSTTVTATVRPSDATNKTLLWTSGNPNIATVENGVITAKSLGEVIIMATSQDGTQKTSSCIVNVTKNILVNSICISPSSVRITQGHDRFLYASVYPLNATNRNVFWRSSDTSIITINEDSGHLYAKKVGTAKVYATARDGSGACGCCCVTVEPPIKVSNITISSPNNKTSINVNQSITLSATVTPLYAEDRRVLWTTDNCNVAIVDSATGRVCGRSAGSAVIRATARDGSGVYGEFTVTVKTVHVTGVSINPTTYSMEIGQSVRFSATVSPSNATNKSVTWRSSDTSVATVNNNGCVVAKNIGTTTISVKTHDGDKTAVCDLTVRAIDTREKVIIKRDGNFNKIVFQTSGKEWLCINYDLINDPDNLISNNFNNNYYILRDRLCKNTYETVTYWEGRIFGENPKSYTDSEKKLLYMLDPLGFAAYVQEYASYVYSGNLSNILDFKDSVFKLLFNRYPNYFSRNNTGEWYDATHEKDNLNIDVKLSESELFFGTHPIYDLTFTLQCFDVVFHILALPVAFQGLVSISVPVGYATFLKRANLIFTLSKSLIEEDFETFIETLIDGAIGELDSTEETKSENFNMDWAKALFELSDSFGELADILADKPTFYKEIFDRCAADPNYRIFFQYNNGTVEEVFDISNKLP